MRRRPTIIPDSEDEDEEGDGEGADLLSATQQEAAAIYEGPGGPQVAGCGGPPSAGQALQPSDWDEIVYKACSGHSDTPGFTLTSMARVLLASLLRGLVTDGAAAWMAIDAVRSVS